MKVLLIQGAGERGGAERALLALAKYLPHEGFTPHVLFLDQGPFVAEVERQGIEITVIPVAPRARRIWQIRPVQRIIERTIEEVRPVIVQASGEHMAIYSGWASRRSSIPSVFWLHDAPLRNLKSALVQLGMITSPHSAVAAGSAWMSKDFKKKLGIDVHPIPYGVDPDSLPKNTEDVKAESEWPREALVVGHFGRLQKWKGQDVFIRAAARIQDHLPNLRFLVVGGALYGWERKYSSGLPILAEKLGLGNKIRFTGHRENALAIMAACDIVIHSSTKPEPLGIVVPEAFGLGRAVIASKTLGPEEVIQDGKNGLLVQPGNVSALAEAIRSLALDGDLRAQMGAAAATSFSPFWTAARMAADFASLYKRILRSTSAP